ncbi:uncharacterized protein LOC134291564 [Aedes albopictus]|uniref:Reverse transcriptase domain-containing protein n=1 Tax=Aedes albopictus TaxID=7160 RepID=A0ABM1Z8W3_AEDAL
MTFMLMILCCRMDLNSSLNRAFSNVPAFSLGEVPFNERRTKWRTWKRGFEIYLQAVDITLASKKKQLLLACGGFELQEIFFNIPGADVTEDCEAEIDPYVVAMQKLDEYFDPQRHEAHERYLFWDMKPEMGETLGKFLMRAQVCASKCNFGGTSLESSNVAVVDKILQFVPGSLREKLLQIENLTLQEAIRQVNAYEMTKAASDQISGQNINQKPNLSSESVRQVQAGCKFCGRPHRSGEMCPAWNKTCSACGKRGHFRSVCFSRLSLRPANPKVVPSVVPQSFTKRAVDQYSDSRAGPSRKITKFSRPQQPRRLHAIEDSENHESETELVEMVSSASDSCDLIWAEIGGVLVEMQIDSGVQSNIIDDKTWFNMNRHGVEIIGATQSPDRKFKAYAQRDCLNVSVMFDAEIMLNDCGKQLRTISRFYVVENGPQPLLGKVTAIQLGVLIVGLPSQREAIRSVNVSRTFPSIRGVKISIPIDKSVTPVMQRLRRLPFATLERVEQKLNELLEKDIIERVEEPSKWVSPTVVVVKDNGDIRLCIDMRQVNKAIIRETHPLPTIEDIRWALNGAQYFTRLDIKDAFHQLELDDESKPLTTFITHKGKLYCVLDLISM